MTSDNCLHHSLIEQEYAIPVLLQSSDITAKMSAPAAATFAAASSRGIPVSIPYEDPLPVWMVGTTELPTDLLEKKQQEDGLPYSKHRFHHTPTIHHANPHHPGIPPRLPARAQGSLPEPRHRYGPTNLYSIFILSPLPDRVKWLASLFVRPAFGGTHIPRGVDLEWLFVGWMRSWVEWEAGSV